MSRLLFAAARGARIQTSYNQGNDWRTVSGMVFKPEECEGLPHIQRIHPNDAHLQYGPISTALRERAELADRDALSLVELEAGCFLCYDSHYFQYLECNDRTTRQTYVLLMAEALADEGL